MGEGLKRVAKQCGGLVARSGDTVAVYDADGIRSPIKGDIWRSANGWERHVTHADAANVVYIQVADGRENVTRNCLPVVWRRWARKSGASFVGQHGGR